MPKMYGQGGDKPNANTCTYRCTNCAYVLRTCNCFNSVACDVCKQLASKLAESATANKTDCVTGGHLLGRGFKHPTLVIADAFKDCTDKFGLACFKGDVEEHASCVGVLKGTTIAVEPRGEDYTTTSRRDVVHDCGHILEQAEILGFNILGDVFLLDIYADFVKCKVVLDPFKTLARGFKFCKVIESALFRRHGCSSTFQL